MEPDYSLKRKPIYIEPVTSRKVARYEENKAPSVSEVKNLSEGIFEHAHLRVQIFHAVAMKLNGVAMRTNRSPAKVNVWVGRATKQDGQGTRQEHAAHSNAAAGLRDDLKEHYIKQILDNGVTPIKADVLTRIRNISTQDLDVLHSNHMDEELVRQVIELAWPGNSVISDTELEDQINATNKLPRNLNLGCDLTLEKSIRPYVAELMTLIMKGELDPRAATNLYVQAIENHFVERLEAITHHLNELKKADPLDVQAIKRWEDQFFYHQTELNGTQALDYDLFEGKKKLDF